VSIAAASTVVTAVDGPLRVRDVGKHIAISGAEDLVAQIDKLLDRKDVASTSMTADSTTLMAVLTPVEGFFQAQVHEGLRVTVTGSVERRW
jgi:hypothetical protein